MMKKKLGRISLLFLAFLVLAGCSKREPKANGELSLLTGYLAATDETILKRFGDGEMLELGDGKYQRSFEGKLYSSVCNISYFFENNLVSHILVVFHDTGFEDIQAKLNDELGEPDSEIGEAASSIQWDRKYAAFRLSTEGEQTTLLLTLPENK